MPKAEKVNKSDFLKILEQKIAESGLRLTKPRQSILQILLKEHGPFSCEEIFAKISQLKALKNCDLVTIYRSMAKLEEVKIVDRCDFGDGKIRYEIKHESHHHHHIICRTCKLVKTLSDCKLIDNKSIPSLLGFADISHRLEFFGICPKCQTQSPTL